jgi:hypothetical protein
MAIKTAHKLGERNRGFFLWGMSTFSREALQNPMRRFIPNSGALLRWISCRDIPISASKSALHGIPILGETCTQQVLQSFPKR